MGASLSTAKGHGRRLLNRYNAQNRALDLVEYERLPKAPRHPSYVGAEKDFRDALAASETQSKDVKLDEYLKNIYVRSFDETSKTCTSPSSENSKKSLPARREAGERDMFPEPAEIAHGYCTLTQVSKFIAAHAEDAKANDARSISEQYNLNVKTVENVLKYYTVFREIGKAEIEMKKTFEQELGKKLKTSGQMKEIEEKTKNIYLKPFAGMLSSLIKKNEEREKSKDQLHNK